MCQLPSSENTDSATLRNGVAPDLRKNVPYPRSFAEVVELIHSGSSIPGIEAVPDTLLEGQASTTTAARRKKPWETES